MTAIKRFNAAELAAYNAAHTTPHRKVVTAQVASKDWLPVTRRNPDEFGYRRNFNAGETAEQVLERKMLHGEDS